MAETQRPRVRTAHAKEVVLTVVADRNAAGFVDALCVRYYQRIRAGVPSTARQIGYGVNKQATPQTVIDGLKRIYSDVLETRTIEYADSNERRVRELIGGLLGRFLDLPAPETENVVLCHGSTEAISIASAYAASQTLRPVLPLPNYYAFEHSLARHEATEPVYYSADGRLSGPLPDRSRFLVDVVPNGVLGTTFQPPLQSRRHTSTPLDNADLRMIDLPFSLPRLQPGDRARAELKARITIAPRWLMCLTPSKDISIPGLRAGLLIGNESAFTEYAAADRFERGYAVHAAVGPIIALHLGLLCLSTAGRDEWPDVSRELTAEFNAHRVPFLDTTEAIGFLRETERTRDHFLENLRLIDRCELFDPVDGGEEPVAGYSTFRWLRKDFASPDAYTNWINQVGMRGMKLNPNCLFGGSPTAWQRLYPGRYGIRLNLSVPHTELRENLWWLRRAFDDGLDTRTHAKE